MGYNKRFHVRRVPPFISEASNSFPQTCQCSSSVTGTEYLYGRARKRWNRTRSSGSGWCSNFIWVSLSGFDTDLALSAVNCSPRISFHSILLFHHLKLDRFPTDISSWTRISSVFLNCRSDVNTLRDCLQALDCIALHIQKSLNSEVSDPESYYHRKWFYAVPVQATCDSNNSFMFFSAKCAGPRMVRLCSACILLLFSKKDWLPEGFWIAAGEFYLGDKNIITPVQTV